MPVAEICDRFLLLSLIGAMIDDFSLQSAITIGEDEREREREREVRTVRSGRREDFVTAVGGAVGAGARSFLKKACGPETQLLFCRDSEFGPVKVRKLGRPDRAHQTCRSRPSYCALPLTK